MAEDLYSLAYSLKDLLSNDSRIVLLDELEKEMNENEEVMALAYQKDLAVNRYSDALNHFAQDSEEMKQFQHELFIKKEALDNHLLVRDYLKAYGEVRDLYFKLNEILFSGLNLKMKENH